MSLPPAKANPTKAFFVRMITRDISLSDCILDLVDNSVDAASVRLGSPPTTLDQEPDYSPYRIDIEFSADRFRVRDNCGGISLDDATDYAFTFGRRDDAENDPYSIGVYGIGMKRAVFKLGETIRVHSTYRQADGALSSFAAPINVPAWLAKPDPWDFDLEEAADLGEPGVEIVVESLHDGVAAEFGNPTFVNELAGTLRRDYARFLSFGLTISLNGKALQGIKFEILAAADITPVRTELCVDDVKVDIIAGMGARPLDDNDPDALEGIEDRWGWYVLCNDRVVIAANKSEATGWGENGVPKWHPQYAGFVGLILISAKDAVNLPLTTTKRSVDQSSAVYRATMGQTRDITKTWIEYTNQRKASLPEAKQAEATATPVSAFSLAQAPKMILPQLTPREHRRDKTISYRMEEERVRALAEAFRQPGMSPKEVGVASFEFAEQELVEDE
ncbi:MAG TPA: ATP-binding protein [Caulobacteraceae bacterium]|nr:ATP-binding protein [Caulobacteraceae bacterium]